MIANSFIKALGSVKFAKFVNNPRLTTLKLAVEAELAVKTEQKCQNINSLALIVRFYSKYLLAHAQNIITAFTHFQL